MKKKCIALLCALLAAAVISGCKSAPAKQEESIQTKPAETAQVQPEETTQAKPEEKPEESLQAKAEAAYREILKAAPAIAGEHAQLQDASFDYEQNQKQFGNHYDLFALTDINQDGIPELIALTEVNFRWTPISVFTFAEDKAVLLKDPLNVTAHGTFEQCSTAGGSYATYICGENHIHSVWKGMTPVGEMEENYGYTLSGTDLQEAVCTAGENEKTVYFYDIAKPNTEENLP